MKFFIGVAFVFKLSIGIGLIFGTERQPKFGIGLARIDIGLARVDLGLALGTGLSDWRSASDWRSVLDRCSVSD